MNSIVFIQIGLIGLLIGGAGLLMLNSGIFSTKIQNDPLTSPPSQKTHQILQFIVFVILGASAGMIILNLVYLLIKKFTSRQSINNNMIRRNSRDGSRRWREFINANQQSSRVFSSSSNNPASWPPSYDNFAIDTDENSDGANLPGYKSSVLSGSKEKLPNYDEIFE